MPDNNYIINSKTCALLAIGNETKIIEKSRTLNINAEISSIISSNCYANCSTLEGRQKASAYLIGTNYKPPIILNEKTGIILIPTHSNRNKKCNWLVLANILNYYPGPNKMVQVEFNNNMKIDVPISYSIFDRQVLRATRLESILRGRKNQKF